MSSAASGSDDERDRTEGESQGSGGGDEHEAPMDQHELPEEDPPFTHEDLTGMTKEQLVFSTESRIFSLFTMSKKCNGFLSKNQHEIGRIDREMAAIDPRRHARARHHRRADVRASRHQRCATSRARAAHTPHAT